MLQKNGYPNLFITEAIKNFEELQQIGYQRK